MNHFIKNSHNDLQSVMNNHTCKTSTTGVSLLMLNDDCLITIFEFLNLFDLTNLSKTCCRLREIANFIVPKNINLDVTLMRDRYGHGSCNPSMEQFTSILSMISENVKSIKVHDRNLDILKVIRDNSKNLSSLELYDCDEPIQLSFLLLKELKLHGIMDWSANKFKNCFASNPNIECLEYDSFCNENLTGVLNMLPKLRSLTLGQLPMSFQIRNHLLGLNGITKFSFRSPENCNRLLLDLANKWNLLELEIDINLNAETFDVIKLFRNLKFLTVKVKNQRLPVVKAYPLRLRRLKLDGVKMVWKTLLTIVRQLKFLEEFDMGDGHIFSHLNIAEYFPNRRLDDGDGLSDYKVISKIDDDLRLEFIERRLTIIYYDDTTMDQQPLKYNSDHLKVVNSWITAKEHKTHFIYVSTESG